MGVCKTFFLSFKAPDTVNVHVKLTVGMFLIGSAAVSAEYYLKKKKKVVNENSLPEYFLDLSEQFYLLFFCLVKGPGKRNRNK